MNVSSRIQWIIGFMFLSFTGFYLYRTTIPSYPLPTGGNAESYEKQSLRKAWFERMHRTAPGSDWRQIEYQNRYYQHRIKSKLGNARSDCQTPVLIPGTSLEGRWVERGSNNQTGSIFETAYDPQRDEIWVISAGGTLWKSPRQEAVWQMVNQDLQFNQGFLEMVSLPGAKQRLLAFSGRQPHYSDDGGLHWQQALGIPEGEPASEFHTPVLMPDNSSFVLAKADFYKIFEVYRSTDYGESYHKIMGLDSNQPGYFSFCQPHQTEDLILARKTTDNRLRLQEWNRQQEVFVDIAMDTLLSMGGAPANLIGGLDSMGHLQLFTYLEKERKFFLYRSRNKGRTWKKVSELPESPWEVGLFLSPHHPEVLYLGEVEAYRSLNSGKDWEKINEWWEYYDDIENALHADIMAFSQYQTTDQEIFTLISHHGGISISYDQFSTQKNIGLFDLNTSQYYCVRTDPNDPNFVYAGSQDQGLQRAVNFESGPGETKAFEQLISGDYGPIVLTREGTALWTVYPEGWINYYDSPQDGYLKASYELISEDESVWLPPIMANPTLDKNGIILAGGNSEGGPGSYLIQLEYKDKKIKASQIGYDFKLESAGGELSALASAPSDPKTWYTATTNGRFFHSRDAGKTWGQSLNFIPEGHYLYGQAIWISKFDPKTVILAGSGYNNPPVYFSNDGGHSFEAMDEGLPPTLVFALASNAEETLLFAATEAGPFVYQVEDGRWYSLSTPCSPAQTYWSVEYIDALNVVRYGTYGRGIWDFQLDVDTPVPEPPIARDQVRIFPNPTTGPLQITTTGLEEPVRIHIRNAQGQFIRQTKTYSAFDAMALDLSDLPGGVYFLTLESGRAQLTQQVILEK